MTRPLALLITLAWFLGVGPAGAEEGPEDPAAREAPAWWLERAAELAQKVEHPDGRAALLVSIAAGHLEAKDVEGAKAALKEAAGYAKACRGCFGQVRRLADVAKMQWEAGDAAEAAVTLALARNAAAALEGVDRVRALGHVAVALAEVGGVEGAAALFAEALHAVARLGPEDRAYELISLARDQAAAGRFPDARRSLARAPSSVRAGDPDAREAVAEEVEATLAWIAEAAAADGDSQTALATVSAIRDETWHAWALHDVAAALGKCRAAAGAIERAFKSAKGIEFPAERLELLVAIARTASTWGVSSLASNALGKAAQTAAEIEDTKERATLLLALAAAWADAGNAKRAVEALEAAKKIVTLEFTRRERPEAYLALARAEAALGRMDEAKAAAREIGDPVLIGEGWASIAESQLEASDTVRAVVTLEEMERTVATFEGDLLRLKDEALRRAAVLYARAGKLGEAARLLGEIEAPFHAATAATYVAAALAAGRAD